MTNHPAPSARSRLSLFVALVVVYALLVAGYFVLRYDGTWVEQDTTQLTNATRHVRDAATLEPETKVYPFGFGYSALSLSISTVAGIPLDTFQSLVGPFSLVITGLCALVLFRALTGDLGLSVLGALLLCMQPELVFVTLRGSHEKFTWAMVMITLFLLVKSFSFLGRWRSFIACLLLSYLSAFALISLNSFFASSFTFAVATSFVGGWLLVARHLREQEQFERNLVRLFYVAGSCSVLIYLFFAYLYPPSTQMFGLLSSGLDKLSALLLGFDTLEVAAPYEYISVGWTSTGVYLALTAGSWFIALVSAWSWGRLAYRMLWRRERLPLNHLLLWLFYAAFAVQILFSLLADQVGLLATNLQVRLFPAVMVFAIPLALMELRRLWSLKPRGRRFRFAAGALLLLLAFWLPASSILKAVVDPVVSNKWLYYSPAEEQALFWTEENVRFARIWVGYDERLRQAGDFRLGSERASENLFDILEIDPATRYLLLSDLVRQQATRLRLPLPDVRPGYQIYDSGSVQVYQYRPQTPYQR